MASTQSMSSTCGMYVLAVEETSNAMALDGIMFEGVSVRVRRPNDYNPAAAAALGPAVPNPALNLSAIGLHPGGMNAVQLASCPSQHLVFSVMTSCCCPSSKCWTQIGRDSSVCWTKGPKTANM